MRYFKMREIHEAYSHAAAGGQAVHVFTGAGAFPDAPKVFKRHREAAHLFDQDVERLKKTARRLGVNKIVVSRLGEKGQHIDLCGKPLETAKALCENLRADWSLTTKRRLG